MADLVVAFEDERGELVEVAPGLEGDFGLGERRHGAGAIVLRQALGEITAVPALQDGEHGIDVLVRDRVAAVDLAQEVAVGPTACSNAWTMGRVFFRRAISAPTGLPVAVPSPQMPRMSSRIWKARPSWRPKTAEALQLRPVGAGDEGARPDRGAQQRGGLAAIISMYSCRLTSVRSS